MGLRDKLDEMKKRAQRELAERAAKAAVDRSKEAAASAFETAKKRLGDALFGEEEPEARAAAPGEERKAREDEAGRKLREAAARQAEREARAREAAETEKKIDDELAALKRKLGKPDGK